MLARERASAQRLSYRSHRCPRRSSGVRIDSLLRESRTVLLKDVRSLSSSKNTLRPARECQPQSSSRLLFHCRGRQRCTLRWSQCSPSPPWTAMATVEEDIRLARPDVSTLLPASQIEGPGAGPSPTLSVVVGYLSREAWASLARAASARRRKGSKYPAEVVVNRRGFA